MLFYIKRTHSIILVIERQGIENISAAFCLGLNFSNFIYKAYGFDFITKRPEFDLVLFVLSFFMAIRRRHRSSNNNNNFLKISISSSSRCSSCSSSSRLSTTSVVCAGERKGRERDNILQNDLLAVALTNSDTVMFVHSLMLSDHQCVVVPTCVSLQLTVTYMMVMQRLFYRVM